jgi:hypothetical protein
MPVTRLSWCWPAPVVHATWNLLLPGAEDTHAATAVAVGWGSSRSRRSRR